MDDERTGAPSYEELAELVAAQAATIKAQSEKIEQLESRVAELERRLGQNSGNSGLPPSRDPAAERKRQAEENKRRAEAAGSPKRRQGKQRGTKGTTLQVSEAPDEIVDHRPEACRDCGSVFAEPNDDRYERRQVVDLPEVKPKVTAHRAHTYGCACGCETTASFPDHVRAPVSYGPRARAVVAYFLGRQHIPNRRTAEAMADLFGLEISTGAVDSIYAEAGRRLKGFIVALVALLKSLPVLHVDETSDRIGTSNCWMHVVSTSLYTLIHASATRGEAAIDEAGVLKGCTGVLVHDRLAMYFKLKRAKHGLCGAHLIRDLADVAVVATQAAWAVELAVLLVEINCACDQAPRRGWKQLGLSETRAFTKRYSELVTMGLASNEEPARRKRNPVERRSFNLVTALATHKRSILRFMNDIQVPLTNNQAERDLRPSKLHRKISGCFRSQAGAERFADLRSHLSTTRKNGISAIDALTRLYEGDPWMPPSPGR